MPTEGHALKFTVSDLDCTARCELCVGDPATGGFHVWRLETSDGAGGLRHLAVIVVQVRNGIVRTLSRDTAAQPRRSANDRCAVLLSLPRIRALYGDLADTSSRATE